MFEKYNESLPYSYVFGAFGTIKLLEESPSICLSVLISPSFKTNDAYNKIDSLCKRHNITIIEDDKLISKIRDKNNIYVVGVFKKIKINTLSNKHIVLINQNDVGQIGTIIRSMQGFDFDNLVLINSNIDIYHYHLIRATMGSYFKINIKQYDNINDYINEYNDYHFINISNYGDNIDNINHLTNDKISIIFSNNKIDNDSMLYYKFDFNISIDNIVNITLFKLYEK